MDIAQLLSRHEVRQLNQVFETSLKDDSTIVFWTGISPKLAKDWAHENGLKTLTAAMGTLYADKKRRPYPRKSPKSWSQYMKGASWLFAQQACQNRCAVVLTSAPPNVYSTREHSNYREIEEPILKGVKNTQHAIRIDYVHPEILGAAGFRYQIWPIDCSSEWFSFLQCMNTEMTLSLALKYEGRDHHMVQQKNVAKVEKQAKVETEQRMAQEKRAAKQAKITGGRV